MAGFSELEIEIRNRFNELLEESTGNLIAIMRDVHSVEFTSSESRQKWAERILVQEYGQNGEDWLAGWRVECLENFRAEYLCKVRKAVGERPGNVPSHFIIYNAPRALYGQMNWTGDYLFGVFFAAVDPTDQFSGGFAENNRRLDAFIVEYVSQDEFQKIVMDFAINLYKENHLTFDPIQARQNGDWRWLEENVIDGWREGEK